ncbi:MAG TPA: hypothetical protein VGR22_05465 [Thermomicrobiales bacterium]|nr:hypothetical protein [Thermomicrobiales bacterium]
MALLCLVGVLLLVGCAGGDGRETAQPTTPAEAAIPTAVQPEIPLEVGEFVWASNLDPETGAPAGSLTSLPNDAEQVIAVLQVPSLPAGTTVQAQWTIDGDPIPGLEPEPVVAEESLEEAWLSWRLSWNAEEPWPVGTLGIRIEIDGEEVASADIPIVRASL